MTETPSQKFQRISAARLEKATHHIGLLKNLGSKNYEYTVDEAASVIQQLLQAVDEVNEAFGVPVDLDSPGAPSATPEPAPDPQIKDLSLDTIQELDLSEDARIKLIEIGPAIGSAIEHLQDDDPDAAKVILLNLMRS